MKTVVVRPERCVGCLQCRVACAVAHSVSQSLYTAPYEPVLSKPRIHIGLSRQKEPFPNKCRHCEPAPCEMACLTKAIFREDRSRAMMINPDRCINCGMCAMACPFGVIRYHVYPSHQEAAHKCDQCAARQWKGKGPACVEVCKSGALLFDEPNRVLDRETDEMADRIFMGIREKAPVANPFDTLTRYRYSLEQLRRR